MEALDRFVSNTLASNGNQTWFTSENPNGIECGMVFIKVFKGGAFPYIFCYSGIIDSTFADGSTSRCNDVCTPWKINSLSFSVTDNPVPSEAEKNGFKPLTFNGKADVIIDGDQLVGTDPAEIYAEAGQYICLKIEFSGVKIPCHEESIIAIYKRTKDESYLLSSKVPVPVFTGVKRDVKKKIAFIGDSITQGIGTEFNSYMHYAARVADEIGGDYAFWDFGLGFARGADASTDGIWLEKAKHNDIVCICFGVNDLFHGRTAEQIGTDLLKIIDALHSAGAKVIIQTVPPFDYDEHFTKIWRSVNAFVRNELAKIADEFLDNVKFLSADSDNSPQSRYGSHPNNDGNAVWARELVSEIKKLL